MFRRVLRATLVSTAMVLAAPAFAAPGGGGGGGEGHGGGGHGGGAGAGAEMRGGGGLSGGMGGILDRGGRGGGLSGGLGTGLDINSNATRINSEGSVNASSRAMERSNGRSAISAGTMIGSPNATRITGGGSMHSSTNVNATRITGQSAIGSPMNATRITGRSMIQAPTTVNSTRVTGNAMTRSSGNAFGRAMVNSRTGHSTVVSGALAGLTTGATVQTSAGASLGTVSRIVTTGNGRIAQVFVTTSTGQRLRLSPSALSMNGSAVVTSNVRTNAVNSQSIFHASPNGIANASPNSVHSRSAVTGAAVAGLAAGVTVQNSAGVTLGTVSRVITDANGNVRLVLVTSPTGRTLRLAPNTLSMNGAVATTTMATAMASNRVSVSGNGFGRVSSKNTLGNNTVVTGNLAGLTTGLTVHSSTGTNLGTVSRIVTDAHGNIRAVLVTSPTGQTLSLSPRSLSLNGGVVTTTSTNFAQELNEENEQAENEQGENEQGDVDENEGEGSQGVLHASLNRFGHSNLNGALPNAMLPGLTNGLTVNTAAGTSLGTISDVLATRNGMIAGVVVTTAGGQTIRLPASSLSISGNTVSLANLEAFEQTGVPTALLPGLTNGLNVNLSGGASFGTVSQVITGEHGNVVGVVVNTGSQTLTLPASSLTISGNTVTVANTAEAFEHIGVPTSLLPGLATGLTVNTSGGAMFGTVSQVNTGANGNISSVVVTTSGGQTFTVPASSLTISGSTVTVANASEAFESGGVPSTFLPGLATGLTVNGSGGASLGTISQVINGSNGTVVGVVVTTAGGQQFTLPASDLTISGNVVTFANLG